VRVGGGRTLTGRSIGDAVLHLHQLRMTCCLLCIAMWSEVEESCRDKKTIGRQLRQSAGADGETDSKLGRARRAEPLTRMWSGSQSRVARLACTEQDELARSS
jgi:hypothetical protein